jgi:pimeloyl-ACP methyl ester carboxylesterase
MDRVEVDGLHVAFERVGKGPTAVVLLHGYVGDRPATWRDQLDALADATRLSHGTRRGQAPLPVAEHLHAAIAGSTLRVLPGVGHVCNLEAPQPFNDTVRTWLAGRR